MFPSQTDVESFKKPQTSSQSVSELLRQAIIEVLGLRVKFIARADAASARGAAAASPRNDEAPPYDDTPPEAAEPAHERPADGSGWAVAQIPTSTSAEQKPTPERPPATAPASKPATAPTSAAAAEPAAKPATKQATTRSAATPPASAPRQGEKQRYGEAVVREILGANFIEEQSIAPRVTPTREG